MTTAVATAALLLSGCGSSDSGGGDKAETHASAGSEGQPSPGGTQAAVDNVTGVWTTTSSDSEVYLSISGKAVGLLSKHPCTGTASPGTGEVTLRMTCPDGDIQRVTGAATPSADGKTLKIEWGSGTSETYVKSASTRLPTAIPTGLGLPTS